MKRRLMAFAFLSTMLMAVAIFQSNILVSASDPNSWCVCDHWYNKQYLGTPWDLWTASAVTGSPGGGTYYTYHAYWQGGLGANSGGWHPYGETGPLVQYWSYSGSSGAYYNYSQSPKFDRRLADGIWCYGYYHDASSSGSAGGSYFVTVSATDTFNINNGNYYTQYGSCCTIPRYGNSLVFAQQLQVAQTAESAPLFDIEVTYAYVGQRTDQLSISNPIQSQTSIPSLNVASLNPSLICINARYIANATIQSCDAAIEVYQIQLNTDTGVSESYIYTVGTNINPTFDATQLSTLRPYIEALAQSSASNAISGYFDSNLTVGNYITGIRVGSAGTYQSGPSSLGFWSAGQPNSATLSVQRLGCILLNGPSTPAYHSKSDTATTQVQLSKYKDGLLYNTVVLQPQTLPDLFNPPI